MKPLLLIVLVLASSAAVIAQEPTPRISCHLLSTPAVFPTNGWYLTAMYLSMLRLQNKPSTDRCSFRALADLHGRSRSYDGFSTPFNRAGFCPHGDPNFCPWHRFYACAVEDCLREACQEEVPLFRPEDRDDMAAACQVLGLPYWDWTANSRMCTFATATTVRVRDYSGGGALRTLPRNPWRSFIRYNRRSTSLTSVTCRTVMDRLLNSQNYNCLHTAWVANRADRCLTPNLEACHDLIHVTIGGYMSFVPDAPLDPCFQLHHTNGDRWVWLWQQRGGRMRDTRGLLPWANKYTDSSVLRCGDREYYYYTGTTYPFSAAVASLAAANGTADVAADVAAAAAVVVPTLKVQMNSAAKVKEELANIVARSLVSMPEWSWYYSLPKVLCTKQVANMQSWTIHLLLKGGRMPRRRVVNRRALEAMPNYCGAWEMLTCVHKEGEPSYVDVNIDINGCLERGRRRTQVGAKVPPDTKDLPCKPSDFKLYIVDKAGKQIKVKLPKKGYIEWSYMPQAAARVASAAAAAGEELPAGDSLPVMETSLTVVSEDQAISGEPEILEGAP